ncbi:hypothetical protein IEO21_05655 [Rhodonia placenta]|uniref:Uncharacterized protein n=1 Tax=Rhodonia placenta TaxID=104341 RepID=A0A8H7P1V0_9APHY|nr:hypothetical protein IEO21_05655 [Postia placenta]
MLGRARTRRQKHTTEEKFTAPRLSRVTEANADWRRETSRRGTPARHSRLSMRQCVSNKGVYTERQRSHHFQARLT